MTKTIEIQNNLILGFANCAVRPLLVSPLFRELSDEEWKTRYSCKRKLNGRLLLALVQYQQHTN